MYNINQLPFQSYLIDGDNQPLKKKQKQTHVVIPTIDSSSPKSFHNPFEKDLDYQKTLEDVLKKDKINLEFQHFVSLIKPDSLLTQAEVLRQINRLDDALALLNYYLKLNTQDAAGLVVRGLVYKQIGNERLALQDFNDALKIKPSCLLALKNRGILLWHNQFYLKASLDFKRYLEHANSAMITAYVGEMSRLMGDYKEASTYFDKTFTNEPQNAIALKGQAFIACYYGDLEKAKTLVDKFFEKNTAKDSLAKAILGHILLKQQQLDKALINLNESIVLDRQNSYAYRVRSEALLRTENKKQAIEDLQKANELSNNKPSLELVKTAYEYDDVKDKLEALKKYDSINHQDVDDWLHFKGRVVSDKTDHQSNIQAKDNNQKKLDMLSQKLTKNPKDAEALKLRGLIFYKYEDLDKAFVDLQAIPEEVRDSIGWAYMGFIKYKLKDYENAIKYLNRALEIDQKNDLARLKRGETYLELHSYGNALIDLNSVIGNTKEIHSKALFARAKVYKQQGNLNLAIIDCTTALSKGKDAFIEQFLNQLINDNLG